MFKKKLFRFRGLNPQVNIWKLHIDDWISIQQIMDGKVYTKKELAKIEKILSSSGLAIELFTDLVLTEPINDDYDRLEVGSFSASLVYEMIQSEPVEGFFNPEPTTHGVLEFFNFLKSKGVFFGPQHDGYYSWSDAVKDARSKGIILHRQYSFYKLSAGLIAVDNVKKYYCKFEVTNDGEPII